MTYQACLPTSIFLICYLLILGYTVLILWDFCVILHMMVIITISCMAQITHCNHFTVSPTWSTILFAEDSVLDSKVEAEPFLVSSSKQKLCYVAALDPFWGLQQVPAVIRGSLSASSFLLLLYEHPVSSEMHSNWNSPLRHCHRNINYCATF